MCLLVEWVNDAATIAGWAINCNILKFKMCLRDRAVAWWESLQEDNLDLADWDIVKREFMETYEPKYLARTTYQNFSDLIQRNN